MPELVIDDDDRPLERSWFYRDIVVNLALLLLLLDQKIFSYIRDVIGMMRNMYMFDQIVNENPCAHMSKFLELYDPTYIIVSNDMIKMGLFTHSFKGAVRD